MLFNKISGNAEKVKIDGKPATEKMELSEAIYAIEHYNSSGHCGKSGTNTYTFIKIGENRYIFPYSNYNGYIGLIEYVKEEKRLEFYMIEDSIYRGEDNYESTGNNNSFFRLATPNRTTDLYEYKLDTGTLTKFVYTELCEFGEYLSGNGFCSTNDEKDDYIYALFTNGLLTKFNKSTREKTEIYIKFDENISIDSIGRIIVLNDNIYIISQNKKAKCCISKIDLRTKTANIIHTFNSFIYAGNSIVDRKNKFVYFLYTEEETIDTSSYINVWLNYIKFDTVKGTVDLKKVLLNKEIERSSYNNLYFERGYIDKNQIISISNCENDYLKIRTIEKAYILK